MSFIRRHNLNYLYCVEQYFLSLTGKGVGLSPLDHQKIKSWEKRGVPLNVACTGIKKSLEFFKKTHGIHEPPPRSIKFCENLVEKEFTHYKRRRVGAHNGKRNEIDDREVLCIKIDTLINKINSIGNEEKDERLRELYYTVSHRVMNLRSKIEEYSVSLYTELESIDRFFVNEFCEFISPDEFTGLMEEAKERLSIHRYKMSKEAYERTLESLRNLLVRRRFDLIRIEIKD